MINFLTNHPSTNIYYASNTPYIEAFGENKIIADTKKNPPNYILVTNQKSACYGYNYFCKDYGFKICSYVKSDYEKVAVFGSEFKMILYKYRAQKNILSGVVLLH